MGAGLSLVLVVAVVLAWWSLRRRLERVESLVRGANREPPTILIHGSEPQEVPRRLPPR